MANRLFSKLKALDAFKKLPRHVLLREQTWPCSKRSCNGGS